MSIAVVVPTCRPEQFKEFEAAWTPLFKEHSVDLIAVVDEDATWRNLPPFIPSRSGAIRSHGLLAAWRDGYDWVLNLDDDVRPAPGVDPFAEYELAFAQTWPVSNYFDVGNTFGLGEYMRGYPYGDADALKGSPSRAAQFPLLQYGGWDNVPDLDARTQQFYEREGISVSGFVFDRRTLAVPKGCAFTGCIMNVAVKREAIPLLYQFIMGIDRVGYDRWDDIWSGLFAKLICDHLNIPILINGRASVVHTRASSSEANYAKEVGGYELNDRMWMHLTREVRLGAHTVLGCYEDLLAQLQPHWFGPKGDTILEGIHGWLTALQS